MKLSIEPVFRSAEAVALLSSSGLPVSDLGEPSRLHLFGARSGGNLVGMVGIEAYSGVGLLRSLAVEAAYREAGYGRALVAHAEMRASQFGIRRLHFLADTAAGFFAHLGYEAVARSEAPDVIAQTKQFAGLCPATATFMRKTLPARNSLEADGAGGPREPEFQS